MKHTLLLICCLFLALLTGCAGTERNRLEKEYSEEQVMELAKEYLEDKYGEAPTMQKAASYQDICGGMDAAELAAFQGFVIETGDYLTFMDFADDGSYTFSDTKQSTEILQDMRAELEKVYPGQCYLSMLREDEVTANNGSLTLPYLRELSQSYHTYYDGQLTELFSREERVHNVYIYLDAEEDDRAIRTILDTFQSISPYVTAIEYEPGLYDALQEHFDDWETMKSKDHILYYRRRGATGEGVRFKEAVFQKLMDGIYVKCEEPVRLEEDAERGLQKVREKRPEGVASLYIPDGSEKGVLVADELRAFYVVVDTQEHAAEGCFYEIGKEGALFEEQQKPNALLNAYEELTGESAVIFGGEGYLILK